MKGLIIHRLP